MTWRELKNFINKQTRERKDFLDAEVNLYDFNDGEEYSVNLTELLCGEDDHEVEDTENTNWIPYLSINDIKEQINETKAKKTGIN